MPVLLLARGDQDSKMMLRHAIEARYGLGPPAIETLKLQLKGRTRAKIGPVAAWVPLEGTAYFKFPFSIRWNFTMRPGGVALSSGEEAFEKLQQHAADVALVDVRMPESDGYRFLELIRAAGLSLPVVMHTIQSGAETIRRCRELGAVGLVAKGEEPDVLRDAVRAASAGRQFWDGSASHEIGGGGAAFA